jgi:hypothetical protein
MGFAGLRAKNPPSFGLHGLLVTGNDDSEYIVYHFLSFHVDPLYFCGIGIRLRLISRNEIAWLSWNGLDLGLGLL